MSTARPSLRNLRRDNDHLAQRIRAVRLQAVERIATRQAARQLTESLSVDWVQPYAELLDRWRTNGDPVFTGPAAYWNRRYGKDWPIHQTEQELALFRAPSRVLCATAVDAQALIAGVGAYVIGSGYTYRWATLDDDDQFPKAAIKALQKITDKIQVHNAWKGGENEPVEMETLGRSMEDGEFIIVSYPQSDGMTDFRIKEPEQLTQPPGSNYYDWLYGVCTDPGDVAKPLAYWFQEGDSPEEGEEATPDEVVHFRRNGRRGMKRGMPDFAFQTFDNLQAAGRIRLSLGATAAKQAAIEYVMEHENGAEPDIQEFRNAEADYQVTEPLSGQTVNRRAWRRDEGLDIPKGQKYVDGPGAPFSEKHLAILKGCLNGAVGRWAAFEWLVSGDAASNNMPTDLSTESKFVKKVSYEQSRYTASYRKPVLGATEHYVRTRGLNVDGREYAWEEVIRYADLLVEAPAPEMRNKAEESSRGIAEIEKELQSPQAFMQEQGRDPARVAADIAEWKKLHPQPQVGPDGKPAPGGGKPPAGEPPDAGPPPDRLSTLTESLGPFSGARGLLEATGGRGLLESGEHGPAPYPGAVLRDGRWHVAHPAHAEHEGATGPQIDAEDDHLDLESSTTSLDLIHTKTLEINRHLEHQDDLAKQVGANPAEYKAKRQEVIVAAETYIDGFRAASKTQRAAYTAEAEYEAAKQADLEIEELESPRRPRDPAKQVEHQEALVAHKAKKAAALEKAIEAKRREVQVEIGKVKAKRSEHRLAIKTLSTAREHYLHAASHVSEWLLAKSPPDEASRTALTEAVDETERTPAPNPDPAPEPKPAAPPAAPEVDHSQTHAVWENEDAAASADHDAATEARQTTRETEDTAHKAKVDKNTAAVATLAERHDRHDVQIKTQRDREDAESQRQVDKVAAARKAARTARPRADSRLASQRDREDRQLASRHEDEAAANPDDATIADRHQGERDKLATDRDTADDATAADRDAEDTGHDGLDRGLDDATAARTQQRLAIDEEIKRQRDVAKKPLYEKEAALDAAEKARAEKRTAEDTATTAQQKAELVAKYQERKADPAHASYYSDADHAAVTAHETAAAAAEVAAKVKPHEAVHATLLAAHEAAEAASAKSLAMGKQIGMLRKQIADEDNPLTADKHYAKIDALEKEQNELIKKNVVAKQTHRQQFIDAISPHVKSPVKLEVTHGEGVGLVKNGDATTAEPLSGTPHPAQQAVFDDAHAFLGKVAHGPGLNGKYAVGQSVGGREFYSHGRGRELPTIAVGSDYTKAAQASPGRNSGLSAVAREAATKTHVHELGHWLETNKPGLAAAAKAFLAKRTAGEQPFNFAQKFPGRNYRADEQGFRDDFDKAFPAQGHYVGKIYSNATEIVSMGLEKLYDNAADFAAKDPEYFKWMVQALTKEAK